MQFVAKARFVRFSPFKLRPLADVVRGKSATFALQWLKMHTVNRSRPLSKVIGSAVANAKNLQGLDPEVLVVKEIRVDAGPMVKYYKPGAMGRSNVYRKRMSHISIVLESIEQQKA